ncbi:MAG: PIN-like domain-containing protein [Myxococcota bacterium]
MSASTTAEDMLKEMFRHYYPMSQDALSDMVKGGAHVAVDANVLLHLYRWNPDDREELLRFLEVQRDRLKLPFVAAEEYHRNRVDMLTAQHNAAELMKEALTKFADAQEKALPGTGVSHWANQARHLFNESLGSHLTADNPLLHDPVAERVNAIFEGRVSDLLGDQGRASRQQEAEQRIKEKVPPGYKDAGKDDAAGDVLIWFELLELAKKTGCDVLFVTDDSKEDWWLAVHGRRVMPRPELRKEMLDKTGRDFYLLSSSSFLRMSSAMIGEDGRQAVEAADHIERGLASMERESREMQSAQGKLQASLLPESLREAIEEMQKPLLPESLRKAIQEMQDAAPRPPGPDGDGEKGDGEP